MSNRFISKEWTDRVFYFARNPTGAWADFNPVFNAWTRLNRLGEFDPEDIPEVPDPADYPDLDLKRTFDV